MTRIASKGQAMTALVPRDRIDRLAIALSEAATAEDVRRVESEIDAIEHLMKSSGLWDIEEIRPVNETRMRARWKLGRLLSEAARGKPFPGSATMSPVETRFRSFIASLHLDKSRALEAQRIATLPHAELDKALALARAQGRLMSFNELLVWARPYWYRESRQHKHEAIAAEARATIASLGPFPLIYADPPWRFDIYSEKGLERTPDRHYPTLSDQEIIDFCIDDTPVSSLAHDDAALFLWCTSSNLERALDVVDGWGFTFKSSAVWVKDRAGLGLVFRNMHEVLLYATRGNMPGPQHQPPSVFSYPRGAHSAKPPEIRGEIEKMYPDFDARTRLELFARADAIEGWTLYGNESNRDAAA